MVVIGAFFNAIFVFGFAAVLTTAFAAGFETAGFATTGFETIGFATTGLKIAGFATFAFVATVFAAIGLGTTVFAVDGEGIKPSAAACNGDIFDITFS